MSSATLEGLQWQLFLVAAAPPVSPAVCAWHAAEDLLPCHASCQPAGLRTACCWWLHAPGCLTFHACCRPANLATPLCYHRQPAWLLQVSQTTWISRL